MNANKCWHYHNDCFMAMGSHCKLLTEQIEGTDCPFYKTQDEVDDGRLKAHQHLLDIGRKDLVTKYEYNTHRTW